MCILRVHTHSAMILSWIGAAILVVLTTVCTRHRPLWGLYAVMVSIPLSYKTVLQGTPLYFIVELTVLPFVVVVLSKRRDLLQNLRRSPFVAFIPFLGFIVLSALWAEYPASVIKEVVRWLEFVLVGLAATVTLTRRTDFHDSITFLGWISAIVSVVGIIEFLLRINQNPYRPGAAAFIAHPNPSAAYLSLCTFPILGLLVKERGNDLFKRATVFLILVLGLAFTFSRGVLLADIIGGVFFLIAIGSARTLWNQKTVKVLLGIILVLGGLVGIARFRETAITRLVSQSVLDGRELIYPFGWTVYKEHPWLGLGAGNLKPHALKYDLRLRDSQPFEPDFGDLHNLFLQLAVETGGAGLFLFIAGFAGFSLITSRRKTFLDAYNAPLYWSISAASIAYLLSNCSGVYTIKGIQLAWALLLALQASMTQPPPSDFA